ncbi:MAG TPA: triose-phosphate isomerase [Bacillota bacterium]|nr:triose-phosphate isomerase [Bacillota bacterium]
MDKSKRRTVIAGNWKMNKTPSEARTLACEIAKALEGLDTCDCVDVVVCVPFVDICTVAEALKGTRIKIGAQNVHFKKSGAYTGEISAPMLAECGVTHVVVGHSERRQYFGETDEVVNLRAKAALEEGITPIICVGELLAERDAGITEEVVSRQTKLALAGFSADEVKRTIIAYEPVWAIGTGRNATAEQAEEVCALIRNIIAGLHGKDIAEAVTIQYGGSMKAGNAAELLAQPDVDGGLIGGASLSAEEFVEIVKAAL